MTETLTMIMGIVLGGIITPLTDWIKTILPKGFPIQTVIINYALCILATWGLAKWLMPGWSINEVVVFALAFVGTASQATSALSDSVIKKKGK